MQILRLVLLYNILPVGCVCVRRPLLHYFILFLLTWQMPHNENLPEELPWLPVSFIIDGKKKTKTHVTLRLYLSMFRSKKNFLTLIWLQLSKISRKKRLTKITSRIFHCLFFLLANEGAENTRVTGKCLITTKFGQLWRTTASSLSQLLSSPSPQPRLKLLKRTSLPLAKCSPLISHCRLEEWHAGN